MCLLHGLKLGTQLLLLFLQYLDKISDIIHRRQVGEMDEREDRPDLIDREAEILQLNDDVHVGLTALVETILLVLYFRDQQIAVDIVADSADLDSVLVCEFTDFQKRAPPC